MGWLVQEDCDFSEILAIRPVLQKKYQAFLDSIGATDSLPEGLLRLCRALTDVIHGLEASDVSAEEANMLRRSDFSSFSESEQAALIVANRMPYDHHGLTDAEIDAVKQHLGEAGCVTLLTACAFFDAEARLKLTFNQPLQQAGAS